MLHTEFSFNHILARKNRLVDHRGNQIKETLYPVPVNRKYGFIDRNGAIRIEPQFTFAGEFYCGRAAVLVDDQCGYIDYNGRMVIESKYNYANQFCENLAEVNLDGSWGYINTSGQLKIKHDYGYSSMFNEGLAWVKPGRCVDIYEDGTRSTRLLNTSIHGNVKDEEYQNPGPIKFINTEGNTVIDNGFTGAKMFSEEVAPVRTSVGWGYINSQGCWTIEPVFQHACIFSNGVAGVRVKKSDLYRWFYIDHSGEKIFDREFIEASDFVFGCAHVRFENKKYGVIDQNGNVILESYTDPIRVLSENAFCLRGNGGYRIVDRDMKIIVDNLPESPGEFLFGVSRVDTRKAEMYGYIDINGEYIWEPTC